MYNRNDYLCFNSGKFIHAEHREGMKACFFSNIIYWQAFWILPDKETFSFPEMKSGFLIRGQVPSLKGKALRKSPDASRGYPSWSRNLSLFQVKYKIPREGKRNFCYSCRFKIRESFVFKDFLLFEFIMNGIASQRRNTSLPENFLSSWRLRIRNPLDLDSEGVLAFFCVRPLQLTTWYTTRKNRASPMEGGPVFFRIGNDWLMEFYGKYLFSRRQIDDVSSAGR